MRLLVIGAAGRTGRLVVEQAVGRGHTVTALARRTQRVPDLGHPHRVVEGDASDPATVARAADGQDGVLCAVGSSAILRALLPALAEAGVSRLVMTSSRSIVGTRPRLLLDLVWWRFREAYADLARAEGMLEASGTRWSIVRATMLRDGPTQGAAHRDFEADATGGRWTLRRTDYAAVLLDVLQEEAMVGRAVGVGGAR